DLTRITRNKVELRVRTSDLRQLVQDAGEAVSSEVRPPARHLRIELAPEPVWLQVDPDRVVQMLVNLLANATRYTDPGGTIVIGSTVEPGHVVVWVRDSGQGLHP